MNTNTRMIPLRPDVNALAERSLLAMSRAVLASSRAALRSNNDPHRIAAQTWPHDDECGLLLRAATAPATTTSAAALGQVTIAFLASLVPFSAAADLFSRALTLAFEGASAISVPNITPPLATFVREGDPIPVRTAPTSAGARLEPFKLATIVGLTHEMINGSNAEVMVRRALAESVGPSLDAALFSADPGTLGLRPPGLLAGIAALTPSANTNKADAMVEDIAALVGAVASVAGNGGIAVITSPAQAAAIGLRVLHFPYALLVSSALESTVIAVALNGLVSVPDAPRIDASRETILHYEDSAPAQISTVGSPNVVSAPVASTFQTDSVSLRLIMPVAWSLRSSGAVAWVEGATW